MVEVKVKLPDNNEITIEKGKTVLDLANKISPNLAKASLAAKVDDKLVDLTYPIEQDCKVELITARSDEAFHILNHSAAHVLASAVVELFPEAKPTIGPSVDEGFYYDFEVKKPFSQEDLEKIEKKMIEIIEEDTPFIREEVPIQEAIKYYKTVEKNKFKVEILEEMPDVDTVSFYSHRNGKFKDLCRGPHVPSTKKIKAVKVLNASSAFWRGDAKRESLQRVYGIAFTDSKKLKKHLKMLEEAKKRDHRILGPQLDLFDTADEWGPGMP
ncbi:MAG: TGS domain-containing protein, partial [Candidatus Heimdallarchaeaceae archaeon]